MANRRMEWIRENREKLLSGKAGSQVESTYTNVFYDARELEILHGTYQFEQQMLELIRKGKPEKLKTLLMDYTQNDHYNEGTVASDALRQAKNIFVALVAMIGKTAAIPGGMPIEQAYYLIDAYTQQCEQLDDIEQVYILQYNMIIAFAERVEKYNFTSNLSPLIRNCTNFIIFHLNEPIKSIDVIEYSGKSRSFLSERFRKETGYQIGSFITKCKIDEARSLLRYTSREISEISNYLAFSSQPYFQNVFKKATGYTPQQYRNNADNIEERKKEISG